MRFPIRLCGSWLFIAACTTPAPAPVVVGNAVVQSKPAVAPAVATGPECPIRNTVCTMDYSPMVCSSPSYEGKKGNAARQLIAWGANACEAKLNLQRTVCALQLLPSKLGAIQCVPDASGGHCPPKGVTCAAGGRPTDCIADTYGVQHLDADLVIKASGGNECEARANVAKEACHRNLDPEKFAEARCTAVVEKVQAPLAAPGTPSAGPTSSGETK
jgi:hypothetical protein